MTATLPASLRPDCAHCVALCCVAPAFDAEQGFGYDKPACEPCRHLQPDNRCGIHPALVAQGFSGCASFNCFGAGQRATAAFTGGDWRASPEQASRLFDSYARLRSLHELLAMATLALPLARDAAAAESVQQVLEQITRLCETTEPVDGAALRRQTLRQIQQALRGVTIK
jgi:hypothetical protein